MKKSILRVAIHLAYDYLAHHPQINHYPHYSFIIVKNKIVSWATNTCLEPPIYLGYHRSWDGSYKPKFHAEWHAYRRSKITGPFDIVNIRLNKSRHLRLSKPCKTCFHLLSSLGCRKFWYTDQTGFSYIKAGEKYTSKLYDLCRDAG